MKMQSEAYLKGSLTLFTSLLSLNGNAAYRCEDQIDEKMIYFVLSKLRIILLLSAHRFSSMNS